MAKVLTNQKQIADFERVILSMEYSHQSAKVENTSGAAIQLKGLAYPLKAGSGAGFVEVMTALESATPANIVGFLVTNRHEELAATTGVSMEHYAYLDVGPVVVSEEGFAAADPHAGAAYDVADFKTFCAAANPPIKVATSVASLISAPLDGT
jgi:hypothetical protein